MDALEKKIEDLEDLHYSVEVLIKSLKKRHLPRKKDGTISNHIDYYFGVGADIDNVISRICRDHGNEPYERLLSSNKNKTL